MKPPNRRLLFIILGLVGLLGLGGGWYYHGQHGVTYHTVTLERGDIESNISATGSCNAVVSVQVGSQVSGNIKALYADFNTKVKQGQLVALIDPEIFQARVNQARANLDAARAAVANAQASVERANADLASAQANVANDKANVAKAKVAVMDAQAKLARRLDLAKQGVISQEDKETAQATNDSAVDAEQAAEAQRDAGQHGIQSAQAQREVALTQLASMQARVKQSAAALQQAELDLEHTKILAPVDGTVVARRMDVGQTVAASFQAPTIFEIAQDVTKMQVDTNVDEADVGKVRVGQPAAFTVDAYPAQAFHGSVVQIREAPINVQNVITYDVVVAVPNPDLKLFPGMTANVKILTERRENVLKVPNAALRMRLPDSGTAAPGAVVRASSSGGSRKGQQLPSQTVWVQGEDGKPQAVKVQMGASDGNFTVLESGDLHEGQRVIVGVASKTAAGPLPAARPRGPAF